MQISDAEWQVMNVVWELGDCTSAQVIEAYATNAVRGTDIRLSVTRKSLRDVKAEGDLPVAAAALA